MNILASAPVSFSISYTPVMIGITALWILVRIIACLWQKRCSLKREGQLLLAYICILVVTRFTLFPFEKINGQIQPLLFNSGKIYPFRINSVPFVNLFNHGSARTEWINLIGNITMFIPLGIVWPSVFRELNTPVKVIAAGMGYSLLIEAMQLVFYTRVTDIDDLILNTLGYVIGYGIYLLVRAVRRARKRYCGRK